MGYTLYRAHGLHFFAGDLVFVFLFLIQIPLLCCIFLAASEDRALLESNPSAASGGMAWDSGGFSSPESVFAAFFLALRRSLGMLCPESEKLNLFP